MSNCHYWKKNELTETRGEHNDDNSAGKSEGRNVIKHLKDLSERFTPTVAVASAVLPVTNNSAAQFALPSKDKLIWTAARTRKQLDVNIPPHPRCAKFRDPWIFWNCYPVWQWIKWSRANHFVRWPWNAESSGEVIFLVSRWNFWKYSKNVLSAKFNSC